MKLFSTFKAKITLAFSIIVFLFLAFGGYVFYENNQIKNNFYLHSRHNEPSITRTFLAISELQSMQMALLQMNLKKDTSNAFADFEQKRIGVLNLLDSLQMNCNRLKVLDYSQIADTIRATLIQHKSNYFACVALIAQSKEVKNILYEGKIVPIDSAINFSFDKTAGTFWKMIGNTYAGFGKYAGLKEERMALLATSTSNIVKVILGTTIIILIISTIAWYFLTNYFSISITKLNKSIHQIAEGNLAKTSDISNDEIGTIMTATNHLTNNLLLASNFASEIGKGNFKEQFEPVSEQDNLGHSLIAMRNDLQKFKEEDQIRLWLNQGYAKFGDILRNTDQGLSVLSDIYLRELVKYIGANQGAIFIANADGEQTKLELAACYAYQRKKHVEMHFMPGEGLIGQAFEDNDTLLLTEIPENYISISSGLGEALPNMVVIVPIHIDSSVYGVVEIASFEELKPHQIQFIEKVGENFASILLTVQNTDKNKRLYEQLKEKTEMMQGQEEEMRQNMEELQATQEEMFRKEKEYLEVIAKLQKEVP